MAASEIKKPAQLPGGTGSYHKTILSKKPLVDLLYIERSIKDR